MSIRTTSFKYCSESRRNRSLPSHLAQRAARSLRIRRMHSVYASTPMYGLIADDNAGNTTYNIPNHSDAVNLDALGPKVSQRRMTSSVTGSQFTVLHHGLGIRSAMFVLHVLTQAMARFVNGGHGSTTSRRTSDESIKMPMRSLLFKRMCI